jgi:hypothetical protein
VPILTNAKHELFAQALAKGENASKAYVSAGFKGSRANACRLKANSNVIARVFEIQTAGAQSAEISVASLLAELEEARSKATGLNQLSAAVRATAEKAKISGLLIERQEIEINGGGNEFVDVRDFPEIARTLAAEHLNDLVNSRWLPINEEDHAYLAGLWLDHFNGVKAFLDSVEARPLLKEGMTLLTERDVKPSK